MLVAVLAALVPAGAADAHHTPGFDFEGAGYGHGVGMSQWGALGQALEDPAKPGEEIAAYYFPGSEPASLSDLSLPNDLLHTLENPLWINLGSQITLLEFTALGGPLDLCWTPTVRVHARSRSIPRRVSGGSSAASPAVSAASSTAAHSRERRVAAGRPSRGRTPTVSGSVTVRTGPSCAHPGPTRCASTGAAS